MKVKRSLIREQIVKLKSKGYRLKSIQNLINLVNPEQDEVSYNYVKQINYLLNKKNFENKKFDKRLKNKITTATLLAIRFITLRSRGSLSARATAFKISKLFDFKIRERTVAKTRFKMGFVMRKTKSSPILTENQQKLRLEFAQRNLNKNHENYLFVDETSLWTFTNKDLVCRPKDCFPQAVSQSKKAKEKLHVWAGISSRGITDLVMFTNNLNRFGYRHLIKYHLEPFIRTRYAGTKLILIQDNDSKHVSKLCSNLLKELNIEWDVMPANSPDLNVIELFWASMKRFVKSRQTQNLDQIKESIQVFFRALRPSHLQPFIEHFRMVLEEVIKRDGGWSDL